MRLAYVLLAAALSCALDLAIAQDGGEESALGGSTGSAADWGEWGTEETFDEEEPSANLDSLEHDAPVEVPFEVLNAPSGDTQGVESIESFPGVTEVIEGDVTEIIVVE